MLRDVWPKRAGWPKRGGGAASGSAEYCRAAGKHAGGTGVRCLLSRYLLVFGGEVWGIGGARFGGQARVRVSCSFGARAPALLRFPDVGRRATPRRVAHMGLRGC